MAASVQLIRNTRLKTRLALWPNVESKQLWTTDRGGWFSVPRAMPLIMKIADLLSKGKPVSAAYLELWSRNYGDSFVILSKPREMAFHSGFIGQRAERTWLERLALLKEMGFLDLKPGPSGPASYAILYDPYAAVQKLIELHPDVITPDVVNALKHRIVEVGADEPEETNAPLAVEFIVPEPSEQSR
jgi:hypothetical protein